MLDAARDGDTVTVRLRGDLDHGAADALRSEIDGWIADRTVRNLILDLKDLQFMDSSGVGFVIGRYKQLARRGGTVRVIHADKRMDRIFQMSGLYEIVKSTR